MKARLFVTTLQDHYRDVFDNAIPGAVTTDQWALKYLGMEWLRPIMEAFDDDASGFTTIAEVNSFTASRPKEWRYVS